MMQQSPRAEDCQPSTVCIEGLSTTTTNKQLMNLLNSIGPVEMFTMLPEQRKAIAKFVNPEHAVSFQHSFHSLFHVNSPKNVTKLSKSRVSSPAPGDHCPAEFSSNPN
ncbi:hypothetical protein PO909_023832 [Leuciscus waleckii]